MNLLKKVLRRTHNFWSAIFPDKHVPYNLPTGGQVYLNIKESPMMFLRIIGEFGREKHKGIDFFLSEGDAYIDIGANKGEFAIHAAKVVGNQGKVIAFEPEPENCKWIRKSIEKSSIKNIILEQAAIGEDDTSLDLFIGHKSGWHSLIRNTGNTKNESIPVNVFSLDNYLKNNHLPNLKAIKIDVEGFEKQVLLGANTTLKNYKNLVLFIDIHPNHGVKHSEIYDILYDYNFEVYQEKYPYDFQLDTSQKPLEIVAIKKSGKV